MTRTPFALGPKRSRPTRLVPLPDGFVVSSDSHNRKWSVVSCIMHSTTICHHPSSQRVQCVRWWNPLSENKQDARLQSTWFSTFIHTKTFESSKQCSIQKTTARL